MRFPMTYAKITVMITCLSLFLSSCAKDDSTNPFEDDRDKFLGSWTCKETVQGQAPTTFTLTINSSGDSDTLLVKNFNQLGMGTEALWLVSGNSVTIPSQQITQVVISGFGLYTNNKIELNYTADSETITAICNQ